MKVKGSKKRAVKFKFYVPLIKKWGKALENVNIKKYKFLVFKRIEIKLYFPKIKDKAKLIESLAFRKYEIPVYKTITHIALIKKNGEGLFEYKAYPMNGLNKVEGVGRSIEESAKHIEKRFGTGWNWD